MTPLQAADGFVTPAFIICVAMTMVLLAVVADVLVVGYAEGVMHTAVEEGVRQAHAAGTTEACERRASDVTDQLLGLLAEQLGPAVCTIGSLGATASLTGTLAGWSMLVPARTVTATAHSAGVVDRR